MQLQVDVVGRSPCARNSPMSWKLRMYGGIQLSGHSVSDMNAYNYSTTLDGYVRVEKAGLAWTPSLLLIPSLDLPIERQTPN